MTAPLLLRLASRNVVRNPRRTLVVVVAVTIGVWAMLVYAAFSRGWEHSIVDSTVRTLVGHLQLHAPGFLDDPSIDHLMAVPDERLRAALGSPGVAAWAMRLRAPVVIQSERETAGVTLVGIDPAAERGLSFIATAVSGGDPLAGPDDGGVIIGRDLADRLDTGLGKRVVLIGQAADHGVAERGFRIVGIFDADRSDTENAYVFTGRAVAADLLGAGARISEIAVALRDPSTLDDAVGRLRTAAPDLDVEPWTAIEPMAEAMVSLGEAWIWIFFLLMYVAMAFGLVNTLLMAVLERTREFGLLQALGMRPGLLMRQVLIESVLVLAIGLSVGLILGLGTLAFVRNGVDFSTYAAGAEMWGMGRVIYPVLAPTDFALVALVVVALGTLAGLYPAVRAARRVPADAITRG